MSEICNHGSLKDKCEICERDEIIAERDEEIKRLTENSVKDIAAIEKSGLDHKATMQKLEDARAERDCLRSTLEEIANRPCYGILYNGKNFLKDTMCMNTGFVPENWCASCIARKALADESNRADKEG